MRDQKPGNANQCSLNSLRAKQPGDVLWGNQLIQRQPSTPAKVNPRKTTDMAARLSCTVACALAWVFVAPASTAGFMASPGLARGRSAR